MLKRAGTVLVALGTILDPLGAPAATVYSRPRAATRAPAPRMAAPQRFRSPAPTPRRAAPAPYRSPAPSPRIVVRPPVYSGRVVVPSPVVPDEAPPPPDAAPSQPAVYDPPKTRETGTAVTAFRWYYGSQPSPGWRSWWLDDANRWHERYPDGHEAKVFDRVGRRMVGGCAGSVASSRREPDVEVFIPDVGCGSMSVLFRRGAVQWGSLGPMRDVTRYGR